jgi:predicted NBD/HSP70 family sugar kinase
MSIHRSFLGSNSSTLKSHNMRAVLLTLLKNRDISRVRLAELTGLSATTISNLVADLLDRGIVTEEGTKQPESRRKVGRPRTALRLAPEARHAVGVHIGVSQVRVAVTDLYAHPLSFLSLDHLGGKSPPEALNETAALIQEGITQSGVDPDRVVGVCVGASGLVNPHSGVNVFAPNLDWHNVPIREQLAKRLQLPVCVENNVRAMVLGEALFGAGQGVSALAFVYARVGVGAGFVVDGQLYRGSAAGAGEIGHMTIIPDGGDACRCGNTGCLETLVAEPVIVRLAEELARQDRNGILATSLAQGEGTPIERVFEAARAGDIGTLDMLSRRARYMGIALANLVNVLNPELILLGGVFAQGQDI